VVGRVRFNGAAAAWGLITVFLTLSLFFADRYYETNQSLRLETERRLQAEQAWRDSEQARQRDAARFGAEMQKRDRLIAEFRASIATLQKKQQASEREIAAIRKRTQQQAATARQAALDWQEVSAMSSETVSSLAQVAEPAVAIVDLDFVNESSGVVYLFWVNRGRQEYIATLQPGETQSFEASPGVVWHLRDAETGSFLCRTTTPSYSAEVRIRGRG
jgi:hypothetical protein